MQCIMHYLHVTTESLTTYEIQNFVQACYTIMHNISIAVLRCTLKTSLQSAPTILNDVVFARHDRRSSHENLLWRTCTFSLWNRRLGQSTTNTRLIDSHTTYRRVLETCVRCRWQTGATQYLAPTVLYTDVDGQCDKLVTDDGHQFPH